MRSFTHESTNRTETFITGSPNPVVHQQHPAPILPPDANNGAPTPFSYAVATKALGAGVLVGSMPIVNVLNLGLYAADKVKIGGYSDDPTKRTYQKIGDYAFITTSLNDTRLKSRGI